MSWDAEAKKTLAVAGIGLSALDAIGKLAGTHIKGADSLDALATFQQIVKAAQAVQEALSGQRSIESAEHEIASMLDSVVANDAAIDSMIDRKFPR